MKHVRVTMIARRTTWTCERSCGQPISMCLSQVVDPWSAALLEMEAFVYTCDLQGAGLRLAFLQRPQRPIPGTTAGCCLAGMTHFFSVSRLSQPPGG